MITSRWVQLLGTFEGLAIMTEIVRCVISPGLGIARLGNSPDAYVIGPEAPGVSPDPAGGFKDPAGRIKRQGARFRVYGLDSAGHVVGEVTADVGQVAWRVHLANRKSGWYQFLNAMDLGAKYAKTPGRRNAAVTGTARKGAGDRSRSAGDHRSQHAGCCVPLRQRHVHGNQGPAG